MISPQSSQIEIFDSVWPRSRELAKGRRFKPGQESERVLPRARVKQEPVLASAVKC